eukprot:3127912-Prymnesium_polylepis.2
MEEGRLGGAGFGRIESEAEEGRLGAQVWVGAPQEHAASTSSPAQHERGFGERPAGACAPRRRDGNGA